MLKNHYYSIKAIRAGEDLLFAGCTHTLDRSVQCKASVQQYTMRLMKKVASWFSQMSLSLLEEVVATCSRLVGYLPWTITGHLVSWSVHFAYCLSQASSLIYHIIQLQEEICRQPHYVNDTCSFFRNHIYVSCYLQIHFPEFDLIEILRSEKHHM